MNEIKNLPIFGIFVGIMCSVCKMPYGDTFSRDSEYGIPVYYRWEKSRPLTVEEIKKALKNELTVNWFCSPTCSSNPTNLHEKEKT